jgi:hypothetical protein
MTSEDDFIAQLEGYLDEFDGVTPLPDVVRRGLRLEIPSLKQVNPRSGFMRALAMLTPFRFAAAAVVIAIVAVVGIKLLPPSGLNGGPSGSATPSPSPSPSATPSSSPASTPEVDPNSADYSIGRHAITVDGVSFSFAIQKSKWEPYGTLHLSKSLTGPQGAEALLYWAAYPDGRDADPCADLAKEPTDASVAALADAVATARGVDLYAGPVDVTVGGHPAKYVALTVREDLGCDPGYFYSWEAKTGGALWTETRVGDTIMVWIVEVSGTPFFIVAETATESSYARPLTSTERALLGEQMRQIVESIRFE